MEIPDVIVVNKADHPLADTMVREVRAVLALGPQRSWRVPVVRTEAANGTGVPGWWRRSASTVPTSRRRTLNERRARNLRAEVLGIAAPRMRRELEGRARMTPSGRAPRQRRPARDGPGDCRPEAAGKIAR